MEGRKAGEVVGIQYTVAMFKEGKRKEERKEKRKEGMDEGSKVSSQNPFSVP